MIYLQGDIDKPETWEINHITNYVIGPYETISAFDSKKQARSWVLKELRRRAKEINRVRDNWLRNNG